MSKSEYIEYANKWNPSTMKPKSLHVHGLHDVVSYRNYEKKWTLCYKLSNVQIVMAAWIMNQEFRKPKR